MRRQLCTFGSPALSRFSQAPLYTLTRRRRERATACRPSRHGRRRHRPPRRAPCPVRAWAEKSLLFHAAAADWCCCARTRRRGDPCARRVLVSSTRKPVSYVGVCKASEGGEGGGGEGGRARRTHARRCRGGVLTPPLGPALVLLLQRLLQEHGEVQLSSLGVAISSLVTVAEILKARGCVRRVRGRGVTSLAVARAPPPLPLAHLHVQTHTPNAGWWWRRAWAPRSRC